MKSNNQTNKKIQRIFLQSILLKKTKDLLDRIEHEYLFYRSNLVVNNCFFYFQASYMSQKRLCSLSTKDNRPFSVSFGGTV